MPYLSEIKWHYLYYRVVAWLMLWAKGMLEKTKPIGDSKLPNSIVRKTILIVEKEPGLVKEIYLWLKEQGWYCLSIDRVEAVIPLVNSLDKIHIIILVDSVHGNGFMWEQIRMLKNMDDHVPIIFSTSANDADKEKNVRNLNVYYYHVSKFGMDDLKEAIASAMKYAVENDYFMPFMGNKE